VAAHFAISDHKIEPSGKVAISLRADADTVAKVKTIALAQSRTLTSITTALFDLYLHNPEVRALVDAFEEVSKG